MDVSVPVLQLCAVAALPRRDVRLAPTVLVRHFNHIINHKSLTFSQNAPRDAAKRRNTTTRADRNPSALLRPH